MHTPHCTRNAAFTSCTFVKYVCTLACTNVNLQQQKTKKEKKKRKKSKKCAPKGRQPMQVAEIKASEKKVSKLAEKRDEHAMGYGVMGAYSQCITF